MARLLLGLAVVSLTVYCFIDCIQTNEREIRHLPKFVWLLLIVIAPVVGPGAYILAGRPRRERPAPGGPRQAMPRRPSAPDDDPGFLAGLDRTNEERRRLEAWERELMDREAGLNQPGSGQDEPMSPDPKRDAREQEGPGDEPAARA